MSGAVDKTYGSYFSSEDEEVRFIYFDRSQDVEARPLAEEKKPFQLDTIRVLFCRGVLELWRFMFEVGCQNSV